VGVAARRPEWTLRLLESARGSTCSAAVNNVVESVRIRSLRMGIMKTFHQIARLGALCVIFGLGGTSAQGRAYCEAYVWGWASCSSELSQSECLAEDCVYACGAQCEGESLGTPECSEQYLIYPPDLCESAGVCYCVPGPGR
jgi:hypothetical protein